MLQKKMMLLMHINIYLYFRPLQSSLMVDTMREYVLEAIEQETWNQTTTAELLI